ncbi:hypothetical protein C0584_02345 [Candidatus Parcubacteria bacterium]|nr:MAG: hypothetical protein C0584_02345 [Candidatus Parcubacteria bacterium]
MKKFIISAMFCILPITTIIGWYLMCGGDHALLGLRIMLYGALPSGVAVVLNNPEVFRKRR